MSADPGGLEIRSRLARKTSVFCYGMLFLSLLIQSALEGDIWIVWVARLVPLMLLVPGIVAGRLRSQIWLCFVCLLYFLALVQSFLAFPDSFWPGLQLVLVVSLFLSGAFYVRWHARWARAQEAMQSERVIESEQRVEADTESSDE